MKSHSKIVTFLAAALAASLCSPSFCAEQAAKTSENTPPLKRMLEQRPEADADKDGKDDNAALFGAPEGEYELALPEGMSLDAQALEEFTPTAKKFGLSNEGLTALASEAYPVVEKQVAKANVEAVVAQRKAWEDASRTAIGGGKDAAGNAVAPDPVYGGENQETVMATAAKAIDRFAGDGPPEPGAARSGGEVGLENVLL